MKIGLPRGLAFLLLAAGPLCAAELEVRVAVPQGPDQLASVVYLVPNGARFVPRPGATAVIDQVKKQFEPQVSVIETGTSVSFPNKDNIRHHVYSFSKAKPFELKLYSGKPSNPVVFDQPGLVTLGCNIHDVMLGYVLVVDTSWHAVADGRGVAQFHKVPPGQYEVHAWTPGPHQGEHPVLRLEVGAEDASIRVEIAPVAAGGP